MILTSIYFLCLGSKNCLGVWVDQWCKSVASLRPDITWISSRICPRGSVMGRARLVVRAGPAAAAHALHFTLFAGFLVCGAGVGYRACWGVYRFGFSDQGQWRFMVMACYWRTSSFIDKVFEWLCIASCPRPFPTRSSSKLILVAATVYAFFPNSNITVSISLDVNLFFSSFPPRDDLIRRKRRLRVIRKWSVNKQLLEWRGWEGGRGCIEKNERWYRCRAVCK